MADRRRRFGRGPEENPGVDDVARTDRFIDALAAGRPADGPDPEDPGDEVLAALMGRWRDELRSPPANELVTEAKAAAALRDERVWQRRTHRGLTVIGSAAAAVLALGGLGAVVAGSHPGRPLYPLRSMLFGEPKSVVDDRIELTAKTEMGRVQQMIVQGQWDQAQERLTSLGNTVQTVNDSRRRQNLVDQWTRLNVQVQKRDPNAAASSPPEYAPSAPATTTVTLPATPPGQ